MGTLVAKPVWLAVTAMAVVGFLVLFGGVVSAAAAGAGRAALLTFILPLMVPATSADIPSRLAGWLLAAALAIPTAVFVRPPPDHDALRHRAADACAALARELSGLLDGHASDVVQASRTDTDAALLAFRRQFRSTSYRPVGLTTGSRLLMQLADRLEWLRSVSARLPAGGGAWSAEATAVAGIAAEVLAAAGDVLRPGSAGDGSRRDRLTRALADAARLRATAAAFASVLAGTPTVVSPAQLHELLYTARLAGQCVDQSAAADARSVPDRLLGRGIPAAAIGALTAAERIVVGHATSRSVWFQNSLRGALGLALAVLLADLTDIAHGFWVVLGAMSVLRTTALTTGATALRALLGTGIGFVLGAVLILLVGTTSWHLWVLLPILLLVAAFAPTAVSFVAGQVAFTGLVVILFNIIQPTGWTVGLVRVEDIALGCAAGLVSGVLLWPRGAAAQIRSTLADYYRTSAAALLTATGALRPAYPATSTDEMNGALLAAKASGYRLDDAFREYLFERGSRVIPTEVLTALSNGANRIRLAAEAVAAIALHPTPLRPAVDRALPTGAAAASPGDALASAAASLRGCTARVDAWVRTLADALDRTGRQAIPASADVGAEESVLQGLRRATWTSADEQFATAESLWAAALYVDDIAMLESRLSTRAAALTG